MWCRLEEDTRVIEILYIPFIRVHCKWRSGLPRVPAPTANLLQTTVRRAGASTLQLSVVGPAVLTIADPAHLRGGLSAGRLPFRVYQ